MNPHPNPGIEKRFILSLTLTALILVAEVVSGIWTGSLALRISARPADDDLTDGFHRLEVLAAFSMD